MPLTEIADWSLCYHASGIYTYLGVDEWIAEVCVKRLNIDHTRTGRQHQNIY